MLRREVVRTADGSASISIPEWGETYHSRHGALQEAMHVFVRNGLDHFSSDVSVLEMGFGTGLNALITYSQAQLRNLTVHYTGIEAYPVTAEECRALNYSELAGNERVFFQMHEGPWNTPIALSPNFTLVKTLARFEQIKYFDEFDLIYFDAFGFRFQPDLWSTSIFSLMYDALRPGGLLVTYACRGEIRRNMAAAGLIPCKLPGPPGKREMLQARKPI